MEINCIKNYYYSYSENAIDEFINSKTSRLWSNLPDDNLGYRIFSLLIMLIPMLIEMLIHYLILPFTFHRSIVFGKNKKYSYEISEKETITNKGRPINFVSYRVFVIGENVVSSIDTGTMKHFVDFDKHDFDKYFVDDIKLRKLKLEKLKKSRRWLFF